MISVTNLTKQFEGTTVLKNVSFTAEKNQTIALIGSWWEVYNFAVLELVGNSNLWSF